MKHFLPGPDDKADMSVSAKLTKQLQSKFKDFCTGIGCFEGTFSLQVKADSKPYQAPPRYVAYLLQKPFAGELEKFQQLDMIAPIVTDKDS